MATLEQLEKALVSAHNAGDSEAARVLAAAIKRARVDVGSQIPGTQVTQDAPKEPGIVDQAIGLGEAALTIGTGATAGMVGGAVGFVNQMGKEILSGRFGTREAADAVEKAAAGGMQAATYAPRTQAGQEMVGAVGGALSALPAVLPVATAPGMGMQAARQSAQAVAPLAAATVQRGVQNVTPTVQKAVQAVRSVGGAEPAPLRPGGSVGAAAVEQGTLRQAQAAELPVPIKLTKGQRDRTFEQLRFEREIAKDPEIGEPIRQRMAEQNVQLRQNLDAFIDATGAQAPETDFRRITGLSVDQALRERAARDKARIRTLYKDAEKAGEMEAPVTLDTVTDFLTQNAPEAEVANVLKAARAKAIQLGVAVETPDGQLMAQPVPLKTAELFRRSVSNAINAEPTNMKFGGDIKRLVDSQTEGIGGTLYRQARDARVRYANNYENVGLVKNLLGQKRGTADRAIAHEDVLNRAILDPGTSLDNVRQIRKLLQTEGPNGQQAWRELRGGTVQYIKEQALKGVTTDQAGNRIVSPAQLDRVITQLDRTGKLEFVFGKKGAEQMRLLNDVAKDVMTAPPGTVNTSNTASVLAGLFDVAISGTGGMPLPVATGYRVLSKNIKDSKLRARVQNALKDSE